MVKLAVKESVASYYLSAAERLSELTMLDFGKVPSPADLHERIVGTFQRKLKSFSMNAFEDFTIITDGMEKRALLMKNGDITIFSSTGHIFILFAGYDGAGMARYGPEAKPGDIRPPREYVFFQTKDGVIERNWSDAESILGEPPKGAILSMQSTLERVEADSFGNEPSILEIIASSVKPQK